MNQRTRVPLHPAQKIVALPRGASSINWLTTRLNELGQAGWSFQSLTYTVRRGGGGLFARNVGYWADPRHLVVKRTDGNPLYRCQVMKCGRSPQGDEESLNEEITRQNQEGYALVHLDTVWGVAEDKNHPTKGSHAFVLIFEAESAAA